jgi:hypothetical protein
MSRAAPTVSALLTDAGRRVEFSGWLNVGRAAVADPAW